LGNTGFQVSVVGFGTWAIGGADWGRVDDRDSIKAIHRAVDLGVNLFDTAPLYGNGHAETVLGQALEGLRNDVFIATKCGPLEVRPGLLHVDLSRDGLVRQCDDSLRRLKTDRIDLLQVHWFDPAWPVEETMGHLADLVRAGKVRAIGVSNFGAAELTRAADAGPLSTLQPPYNLFTREIDEDVLPRCAERNLGVLAYEPLARGLLTAKFDGQSRFAPGDIRASDPRFRMPALATYAAAARRVERVAQAQGMTAAQAAIAWVLSRPAITTALCGAKTAAQVVENARAADFEPDAVTLDRLEQAARLGT
jgi:aryl-alcohol dehydrogenase-like predicted oxidoreductase